MSSSPSAVIFDLDDTLIVEEATAHHSFLSAAEAVGGTDPGALAETVREAARNLWRGSVHLQLGLDLGIASWEAMWSTFEGGHECLDEVREWAPAYRLEVWSRALSRCGADVTLARVASEAYIATQRAGHPQLPGALEIVRALHDAGRPVGVLTNGLPDLQRLKLSQLGVDECFSSIVISGEVGVGKPSPEVFRLVLEGLGTSADETIMIGDSWERDVEGAVGAGMRAIWISNGRTPPHSLPGVQIVHTTADAAELLGC